MYLFNRLCLWRQAWTKFYLLILSDDVDKRSKLPSKNGFWTSTYAIVKKTHDQTKPTRRWFYFIEWDEQTLNIWNASRQVKEVLFLSETYLIIPFIGLLLRYYLHVPTKEILSRLSINLGYSLMVLDSYSYDNVLPQLTPINSYSPVQWG